MKYKKHKFNIKELTNIRLYVLINELFKFKLKSTYLKVNQHKDFIHIITDNKYQCFNKLSINFKIYNDLTTKVIIANKERFLNNTILHNLLVQWKVIEDPFKSDDFTMLKNRIDYSTFEKEVAIILVDLGIPFERELSGKTCISEDNFSLFFDFSLFDRTFFIEVDGPHHFPPSGNNRAKMLKYKKQHKKDLVKDSYLNSKNKYLLRLPWYEIKRGDTKVTILSAINDAGITLGKPIQLDLFRNTNISI